MRIGFIISLIFAIIVALFGIQNASVISVNFFSSKFNISLALVIFISAIIGAIVVTLFGLQKEFTLTRDNKRLTKKANNDQDKFENLENENLALKVENETFKSKAESLQIIIEALELKNKTFNDEITSLSTEIERLNTASSITSILSK